MSLFRSVLITGAALLLSACGGTYPRLETVDNVDINKYLGKWYEIELLPNRFEDGCHCTTAQYELIDQTTLRVINTCIKGSVDGEVDQAKGKAFIVEGSNNAKLKVQFFWPFKGDYWILHLDENYNYALVGSPSRKYLWILSRTSALDSVIVDELKSIAESKGFNTSLMIKTDHSCTD